MLQPEIRDRLLECRKAPYVRELLEAYLLALQDAEQEIELRPGDPTWGAIDALHRGRRVLWVFPKSAKVKVDNRIPGSEENYYGPDVSLTRRGEWSVDVRNDADVAVLLRITADAIHHAGQRRVSPGGLSGNARERLTAAVKDDGGRMRISKSDRFAVLVRDDYTCQYCGRQAPEVVLHVDHRVPVSHGGLNTLGNFAAACVDCNLGKGNRFST